MAKLLILYYSSTGTNTALAKMAEKHAKAQGADIRLRKVAELAPDVVVDSKSEWRANADATKEIEIATPEDVIWAEAIIFSFPTRFGVMASQVKQFIDTLGGVWAQGYTANKVVTGFVSTNTIHGGQETTLLSLYNQMMHWGSIVVTPGFTSEAIATLSNPYGTSVTANEGNIEQPFQEDQEVVSQAINDMVGRLLEITNKLN